MKVLFVTRSTIFSVPGGDTVQMEYTAKHLREMGVEVDFLTEDFQENYSEYDLLHFFNITRPSIILSQIEKTNIPYVVSTIYVDYSFYKKQNFDKKMKVATLLLGSDGIEYLKAVAKHFLKHEAIKYRPYFWLGQKRSIKRILKNSSHLLPNSLNENRRLQNRFSTNLPYTVIPNGVDFDRLKLNENVKRKATRVICVAMIEPRKNQLNLILALNDTKFDLVIIGNPTPNHVDYYELCKKSAKGNVSFASRVSNEELSKFYSEAEIHVLPSWFETTGLVSLEAAFMGCKIVVSPYGDTKDYFENYAEYCDPGSVESIKQAIEKAHLDTFNEEFRDVIKEKYTWKKAAELTFESYKQVKSNNQ